MSNSQALQIVKGRHPMARDMGTGAMVDGRWLSWAEVRNYAARLTSRHGKAR